MFLIPTKLIPTALTRLFSVTTKVRMALELLHPPRPSGLPDESVADLVERHYGTEAVNRLADPLLSGIYGGDATQLSARTVLPRLVEMETQYGSLTRGMLAAHRKMRGMAKAAQSNGNSSTAPRPPRSIFTALRGGMQQLVDALTAKIDPASIRVSTPVSSISKNRNGWTVQAGGVEEDYDAIIFASPAWAAGALLAPIDPVLGEDLSTIPYSSSITINLVYDESKLGTLPEGFGFLVPAVENRAMLACTFVQRKFLGRTPPGKAVFRAFLGGIRNESLMTEPDEALIAVVRRELSEILGDKTISASVEPEYTQVTRWRRAMAQYSVGHQDRIARVTSHAAALPGLRLVGNAYDGIGIPDCIRLGRKAAKELAAVAVSD
jgi:protoporphyrinogen/coproporphyrinogen III oxidase